MKIQFLLFICTVYSLFLLPSCNEEEPVEEMEKVYPFDEFIKATGFDERIAGNINNKRELGTVFIPKINGMLESIIIYIPAKKENIRVTLWDTSTQNILMTDVVPIVEGGVVTKHSIQPIQLIEGKQYTLSFNIDRWYRWTASDFSDTSYPIDVKNFSITAWGYKQTGVQSYPDNFVTNYYSGVLYMGFKPL